MRNQRSRTPSDVEIAMQHHRAGRLQQAEALCKKVPHSAQALHLRGIIALQSNKPFEAIELFQQAIKRAPQNALVQNDLGNALKDCGRLQEAQACYQQAIELAPQFAEAHANLGVLHAVSGNPELAIRCLQKAVELKPQFAGAHNDLGVAMSDMGRLDEAIASFQRALAIDRSFFSAEYNLGCALRNHGQLHEAIDCFKQLLAHRPDLADAHNDLGMACQALGEFDDAIACYRKALSLKPDFSAARYNLGTALHGKNTPDEAISCYREVLARDPEFIVAYHALLLGMQYSASFTPEQMAAEHVEFGRRFETPLKAHWQPHANARDPRKRLKIGYVSPDFNRHAVSYSIEPVLARHDKSQVEIFCYYSNTKQDDVTQRLQALADHWIACKHLSDEQLAAQIRADGIDILVDLAGHTGGNRLLAFARKPAPVQLTYLGYPATTGLSAIDYRITDSHAEPPGMTEQFNVEQLWRMPDMFCVYRAHDNSPAVIDHPPCADNGHVTFGCFNNFSKVTDSVLALWARLLDKVPDARLMLEIHGIDDPAQYAAVEQRLARLGIPAERQILIPRKPENQYVLYNRIDIALDPFPCNGGTTSLDTLWMGVPFVTLAGRHFTSRMGVTMLTNAGMQELIAHSEDAYVEIAAALALDAGRLARLRAGLRERVQAGPIMDAQRFTRNFEQALRSMWEIWCSGDANAMRPASSIGQVTTDPVALNDQGNIARVNGDLALAITCYQQALALDPGYAVAYSNLGGVFTDQGDLDKAIACHQRALALAPGFAEGHCALAITLLACGKFGEAVASCMNAIALKPDFADAFQCLGNIFEKQGNAAEAIRFYDTVIALNPDYFDAHYARGALFQGLGRPDDAIDCYRRALAIRPDHAKAYDNMLLAMLFTPSHSPSDVFAEHSRFAQQFEASLMSHWQPHGNPRDPGKRLKVAYVSADFRQHPVAVFIEPVLSSHDKSQFEVFCYYNHDCNDAVTLRLQALADHWLPCRQLSDEQLAAQVRADGIDILVDLAGHTGDNRLQAFARKPAPVQVTYLGYPSTTGLTAIDYRITDAHAEPPGLTEHLNSEQLWRLPEAFFCYGEPQECPAVPAHPPSEDKGYITFGCLNKFSKVNDAVVAVWAGVLEKVPNARLLLVIYGLENADVRSDVEARFARHGIALDRLILVPMAKENHFALYNAVDIALDPFPFNGHTTSLDTLWMGVPFVTLAGSHFASRMGVSVLEFVGLQELVARNEEDYVNIAAALALDASRLKNIRTGLRERLRSSVLMNPQRFTAQLEQAYRGMWRRWCGDSAPEQESAPTKDASALNDAGNALKAQGRLDEAVDCYRQALAVDPGLPALHYNLGAALADQGRLDEAIGCYQNALELSPDLAQAHHGIALALGGQGKQEAAADHYRKALAIDPRFAPAYTNLGNTLREQGKLAEAERCYQRAIEIEPGLAEAHNNLGVTLQIQGRRDDAIRSYRNAIACEPHQGAYNNLGTVLQNQGLLDDAISCYRQAIALNPEDASAHCNLGSALAEQGKLNDAASSYLQALALRFDYPEAYNNLGIVFANTDQLTEAISCYETAIALKPDFADARNNLGNALAEQNRMPEAQECFLEALKTRPDFPEAYGNLGRTYHHQNKPDEALACYRQALALKPGYVDAYDNLLLATQYSASFTPEQMAAEHVEFGRRFETPLKAHWQPHANARDPRKRLKIGYVSPDFNRHAVSYSIEPVLARHDKSQVEIFCYYSNTKQDDVTQRLQALADHWIACKHLSDEQLAAQIRADGIDILVDLAGHTGGNRLLAFARKPAPVQLTYLGYPATTGLSAIDYRITDSHAEPPGMTEQFNVEQLWRMPDMFCVYRAHDNSPAVIDHPPCADNGHVTFGCFNNFSKVTDSVLALWARLLDKVPDARLMLEIHGIDAPGLRADVEQRLERLGLPLERLILVPRKRENQYVLYNRIDIALDPFPCNGGTTSLDTLWMGVPFVTLAGRHFTSRMGVTMLTNAGMQELIAHSEDAYVEIAAALALDAGRLARLRAGLRERVQAGPIMDAQRFTRNFEQALRSMWKIWCETGINENTRTRETT